MNVSAIEIVNVCTYNEENHDKDIENDNNNNNSSTLKHKYKNFGDIQSQSIKSKAAAETLEFTSTLRQFSEHMLMNLN